MNMSFQEKLAKKIEEARDDLDYAGKDPMVQTREELVQEVIANHRQCGVSLSDDEIRKNLFGAFGDLNLSWEVGGSEAATVTLQLYDTGNGDEGRPQYDVDMRVSNGDAVGPLYMTACLIVCVERFYELGLDKKFGQIVGEWG